MLFPFVATTEPSKGVVVPTQRLIGPIVLIVLRLLIDVEAGLIVNVETLLPFFS